MGNFEKHIPDYLRLVRKEIVDLEWEERDLHHSCDCKFCDWDGEITDDDYSEHERILQTIKDREKLEIALKRHAELHGIKIEEEAKV